MKRRDFTADDYRAISREYSQRPIEGYVAKRPRRLRTRFEREKEVDEYTEAERLNEGLEIIDGAGGDD